MKRPSTSLYPTLFLSLFRSTSLTNTLYLSHYLLHPTTHFNLCLSFLLLSLIYLSKSLWASLALTFTALSLFLFHYISLSFLSLSPSPLSLSLSLSLYRLLTFISFSPSLLADSMFKPNLSLSGHKFFHPKRDGQAHLNGNFGGKKFRFPR